MEGVYKHVIRTRKPGVSDQLRVSSSRHIFADVIFTRGLQLLLGYLQQSHIEGNYEHGICARMPAILRSHLCAAFLEEMYFDTMHEKARNARAASHDWFPERHLGGCNIHEEVRHSDAAAYE